MMTEVLKTAGAGTVHILLDKPVSNSGRLKTLIAEIGEEADFDYDIQITDDVDRILYQKENVITSDSIILDHCRRWINLTAECVSGQGCAVLKVWDL